MTRTTEKHLESKLSTLNAMLPHMNFQIDYAYGMQKLTSNNGSRNESGFMSKSALHEYMSAYISGIYAAQQAAK